MNIDTLGKSLILLTLTGGVSAVPSSASAGGKCIPALTPISAEFLGTNQVSRTVKAHQCLDGDQQPGAFDSFCDLGVEPSCIDENVLPGFQAGLSCGPHDASVDIPDYRTTLEVANTDQSITLSAEGFYEGDPLDLFAADACYPGEAAQCQDGILTPSDAFGVSDAVINLQHNGGDPGVAATISIAEPMLAHITLSASFTERLGVDTEVDAHFYLPFGLPPPDGPNSCELDLELSGAVSTDSVELDCELWITDVDTEIWLQALVTHSAGVVADCTDDCGPAAESVNADTPLGATINVLIDLSPLSCDMDPDLDDDGMVAVNDLLLLLGLWGQVCPEVGDINCDGIVDVQDLLILLGAWS